MDTIGPALAQWIDAGGNVGTLILAVVCLDLRERVRVIEAVQRRIERGVWGDGKGKDDNAQTKIPAE